ncbi:MAG: hypothetical protein Q4B01_08965 [Eubacteriales bacterium]|nr:hypothetical protein [Eubacteriales bacterium]
MNKKTLMAAAVLAALALTGCGSKQQEIVTEAPTEAVTEAATEAVTEAPTEAVTEPQTEAVEDSMNKTRVLKGLIISSEEGKLTIQTERGKQLTFSTSGADIQAASGLQNGATVNILYKGLVEGTDTSRATVQMIRDLEAGDTEVTEGEEMTEAEESDPNAGEGTMTGSIYDVNVDRIVVLADDGDLYYFSFYETDINLKKGLQETNYVTVNYTGDIHGPELVLADSITDSVRESDRVALGASAGDYSYINGTIDEITMNSLTITSDNGDQLTFDTTGATECFTEGIMSGNYITIEYAGEISDADASAAKVNAVYTYTEYTLSDEKAEDESETKTSEENAEEVTVDSAEEVYVENGVQVTAGTDENGDEVYSAEAAVDAGAEEEIILDASQEDAQ